MSKVLKIAIVAAILLTGPAAFAQRAVDIESKSVMIGATDVTLAINGTWSTELNTLCIPLVVREITPGAFWTGALPVDTAGAPTVGVTWNWQNPGWPSLLQELRPGPGCATPGNLYDGVSPDNFQIIAGLALGSGESATPNGRDFVYLTFDVTEVMGQFEIDTACFTQQVYTIFLCGLCWWEGWPAPIDRFTKGIITIQECDCSLLGDFNTDGRINPVDVVLMVNYVYKNVAAPENIYTCPTVNCDWDCDGSLQPPDVVGLVRYVYFPNSPKPCDPCRAGEPADLVVDDGDRYALPDPFVAGEIIKLRMRAGNEGGTTAIAPSMTFFDGNPEEGGTILLSVIADDIPMGAHCWWTGGEVVIENPGTYEIYCVADYENAIAESNEHNNTTVLILEVVE